MRLRVSGAQFLVSESRRLTRPARVPLSRTDAQWTHRDVHDDIMKFASFIDALATARIVSGVARVVRICRLRVALLMSRLHVAPVLVRATMHHRFTRLACGDARVSIRAFWHSVK